jgi:eukaryotic-like serine/threonine-protein kinase
MPRAPDLSGCALDGRYELHELIGEGAFGRVYRGLDRRLARPVAVKVIKPWWAEDPDWALNFEREAQLLARVNDPGIVQIFDVGQAEEGLYYVAELVDGESLAARLQDGPLPPWQAGAIAEQLCRALAKAHAQSVVHRDVKPANVLISVDGRVKVGDFGVALLAEGSTDAGSATVVGTPRYMAPEQAQGRPATPATDVYSVGVVLYEMLVGRPPFTGKTVAELALSQVGDIPPPLGDDVPATLQRIVDRALAKDPVQRFEDGGAMANALEAAATEPLVSDRSATRSLFDPTPSAQGTATLAPPRSRVGRRAAAPAPTGAAASTSPGATTGSAASTGSAAATGSSATARSSATRSSATTRVASRASTARRPAAGGSGRRPRDGADAPPTRVAPRPSPRRNVNPAARRRTAALFALVLALLGAMILTVVLTSRHAQVRVPRLVRLTKEAVSTKANRIGLHPKFSSRFSQAPRGTVIGQAPRAGSRVDGGSTVRVTLSGGPPPVKVPQLRGESTTSAQTVLNSIGLHAATKPVPAPGSAPGTIVGQAPASGKNLSPGSTVTLSVAERPRWRALTSFSGEDGGRSVPFKVRGTQWRIVYDMGYKGTCTLIFICSGPSAHIANLSGGGDPHGFDLNEGDNQAWTFSSGSGIYQVTITPGNDSARWSVQIQDYY